MAADVTRPEVEDFLFREAALLDEWQLEEWLGSDQRRSIESLVERFGPRSFAILFIVLMAFPAIPLPTGGVTHVLEIVTMVLAVELIVGRDFAVLGREQHRGLLVGQVVEEAEHLPVELLRVAGEVAELRDGVHEHPLRLLLLDLLGDLLRDRLPLHVSRGENVVSLCLGEVVRGRGQVDDRDAGQVEPEGLGVETDSGFWRAERDEQGLRAIRCACSEEV